MASSAAGAATPAVQNTAVVLEQVRLVHFSNVRNASAIQARIRSGADVGALINASLVPTPRVAHLAAFKALENIRKGKRKAAADAAEVVYCMSNNKHVGGALRVYGVQDDTAAVLGIFLFEEQEAAARDLVEGAAEADLDRIGTLLAEAIATEAKLTALLAPHGLTPEDIGETATLQRVEDAILTSMANQPMAGTS